MAATYSLISSNVLSTTAASVTFSAIPSTYTDLVLRVSARTDLAGNNYDFFTVAINGTTSTYSGTWLAGTGSAVFSGRNTADPYLTRAGYSDAATATSSTFSSVEIYFPNYTASSQKPSSSFWVTENNATASIAGANAGLWSGTSAITSLTMVPYTSSNFVSGSSFYLYGIKNS